MGLFDELFKSKEQREKERQNLFLSSFPFGEKQKSVLQEILYELVKDEEKTINIYNYLVCKETLIQNEVKFNDEDIHRAINILSNKLDKKALKNIHKYIALAEYDLSINEDLNYPSIEEINIKADEILRLL